MKQLIRNVYLVFLIFPVVLWAQDDRPARETAANRYLAVVPVEKMLDDTFAELARQLPPDQADVFVATMKQLVDAERLTVITRTALVQFFTAGELNALADFYGSEHGSSAMQKFGAYMAAVIPEINAEIERAALEMSGGP